MECTYCVEEDGVRLCWPSAILLDSSFWPAIRASESSFWPRVAVLLGHSYPIPGNIGQVKCDREKPT